MGVGLARYKKRVILLASLLVFFVASIGVAWALIFAANQQTLSGNISVTYVAKEVAGTVTASYQVKNKEEKFMTDENGNAYLVFDGSENNGSGGSLTPDEEAVELSVDNNSVVIKYSFTNSGDSDYVAKVVQNNTLNNLSMEVSKDGKIYQNMINDNFMTVFNNTSEPISYYVRFTIINLANDVEADINVTWQLETIPRDTVAVANGEPYNTFDEAVAAVNDDSAATVAQKTSATSQKDYGIVSVIKNAETNGNITLNKDIILYAEKGVTVNHLTDETLFNISNGKEFVLGFPYYNKAELIIESETTESLFVGSGNLTINKGTLDNKTSQGIAVNMTGNVAFLGGTIKNFNTAIHLNETTKFENGGNIEDCSNSLSGEGTFVIDYDYELSNTTVTNVTFKILNAKVKFENVTFSNSNGSALDISSGEVTLSGCKLENCTDSAIKVGKTAKLNMNSSTIQNVDVTVNGAGINVASGATLNFIDSSILNCKTTTDGGAIFNAGTVTISGNSNISNNEVTGEYVGGGVANTGTLTVNGGTFDNNKAGYGGFVYNVGTLTINGGTFTKHSVLRNGGVVYSESKVVTINGGVFDGGNTETEEVLNATNGGAIYVLSEKVEINSKTEIRNFKVSYCGGAIYSAYMDMNSGRIKNCTASDGGGIYVNNADIKDVTIEDCTAIGNGGAVFSLGLLTVNNSIITGCEAGYLGGALKVNSYISMIGGRIENCTALMGGAIKSIGLIIKDATIENCTATGNDGGAIHTQAAEIENCSITNCEASWNGGAIYCTSIKMKGGAISGSSSVDHGGAICCVSTIAENEISGVEITGCSSSKDGGAIYIVVMESGQTTMSDLTITDCLATGNGNAIYTVSNNGIDCLSGIIIKSTEACDGIAIKGFRATINETQIENNARAINVEILTITGGLIKNCLNSAIRGKEITMTGGIIDNCSAANGGAIMANIDNSVVNLEDVTITNCRATSAGGAIACAGKGTRLSITGGEIANCTATEGGAVYFEDAAYKNKATINGTTITNCSAINNGGVVYSNFYLEIKDANISSCYAGNQGGVVFCKSNVTIQGGVIDGGNTPSNKIVNASSGGVAVSLENTYLLNTHIKNCYVSDNGGVSYGSKIIGVNNISIENCEAVNFGGAICCGYDTKITMLSGKIENCVAKDGGAIYIANSDVNNTVSGSFVNNTASSTGGTIALYDGGFATLNIDASNDDSSITSNANFGGAIYIEKSSSVTITGGTYTGLKSSKSGGAITNLGTATINDATFIGCSSQIGGAITNAVASSSKKATMYISGLNISGCSSTVGEGNAIITLGDLKLTGENTIAEDICIARVSTIQGSIALSGISSHTKSLKISFADGSVSFTDILAGNYDNVEIDISGTKSKNNTTIPSGINYTEFSA